ncbi:MAG: hypothetical protein EB136_11220 [Synechococcaceae bacterium WBB_3_034]|jgi:hypothetical protein|nr:hypothetical protein [Synechococcaceae bacterium WBB_3_034]NDG23507.1 hypothetical protein [Synechococcaceae bacterium WBB_10_009]
MTLLIDLVLVVAGLLLWQRSCSEGDDVWVLFLRTLTVIDLGVVVLGNGVLWVELGLLALVLSLPSVGRLERRERRP